MLGYTNNKYQWWGGKDNSDPDAAARGDELDERILSDARFKERMAYFLHHFQEQRTGFFRTYKEQLKLNIHNGNAKLVINLDDLSVFGQTTGNEKFEQEMNMAKESLIVRPSSFLPLLEEMAIKFYKDNMLELFGNEDERRHNETLKQLPSPEFLQVQLICNVEDDEESLIKGSGLPMRKIRKLLAEEVESLVMVSGIVVQARSKRHKCKKMKIRCKSCGHEMPIEVKAGLHGAAIPRKCQSVKGPADQQGDGAGPGGSEEKCEAAPYLVVPDECEYWDMQEIRLQELPEDVPLGDMPRAIMCHLNRCMVDQLQPGNRIAIIGVPINQEAKSRDRGNATAKSGIQMAYLHGLGFVRGGELRVGPKLTSAEEERFKEWARDGVKLDDGRQMPIHEAVWRSVAPSICASTKDNIDMVKQAVACLLFGGARKELPDQTRLRGDINVLLLGDPSTAKSQFLKFVHRTSPICVYTSGKGSSAAGLTAAIVKEGGNGGFALEGGAMVLADGGVVCIDEFDKMRNDDRVAIHEAMEQQTISIAKAGITVVLNTRCSVLAAANPIYGTYDDQSSTAEQIDFAASILSRFDLIFLIRDVQDAQRDFNLAKHVARLHGASNKDSANFVEPPISGEDLKKFVTYAKRTCDPRLTREAATSLQANYIQIRQGMKQQRAEGAKVTLPITVRQLEAISRLSESLARMQLSDQVYPHHVKEAFRLFTAATVEANENRKNVEVSEAERDLVKSCEDAIINRVHIGGKVTKVALISFLQEQGIDVPIARKTLQILVQRRVLEEANNASYKRVMDA
ncbi:unnamed protein product [Amoebophrya sp. A25]|nr:unnamed protein product [Amoebophrya sp. A25]|eukprot:GSA25T00000530001.1